MSTSREIDFDLKLAEYRINGYAVFEDMRYLRRKRQLRAAAVDAVPGRSRAGDALRRPAAARPVPLRPAPQPEARHDVGAGISQNVEMPQASYDALPARGKRLLQRCRIVEWDR